MLLTMLLEQVRGSSKDFRDEASSLLFRKRPHFGHLHISFWQRAQTLQWFSCPCQTDFDHVLTSVFEAFHSLPCKGNAWVKSGVPSIFAICLWPQGSFFDLRPGFGWWRHPAHRTRGQTVSCHA